MAQTTLLTTISRNGTYPVYTNISAPHSCGTVKILVDSTYTEQMLYELPNITINIYTESDGERVLYTSRALTMKVPEANNPIESILVDIPTTCILAVIPEFDDTAFEAHNEAVCTSKEGTKWTEPTETFPITIIWDDTNIYAPQSEGGGGGGSSSASDITYDNSLSGLLGTNVQDVIDEVAIDLNTKLNKVPVQSKGTLINGNGNISVQYLGNAVTGVKGSAESTYRTGNVSLTKENFGLGNVDNTSDLDKPISTATQEALNLKFDTADIDDALSEESENPVQNKVITNTIGDVNLVLESVLSRAGGHVVKITTLAGATVTITNQSNTYTAVADNNGLAEFTGVEAGTYTVYATIDDAVSDSISIVIVDHTATEDSFATLTVSASDNTTITATDGTVTKTLEYTGTPIVQYVSLGTWDLSCTIDDTVITRTVLVNSYTNQNIRLAPPQAISRYVDFTTNTTTITGDPDTHPVYMGINRCNVSDNGTINAYYGDASYAEDGSNGQVMVKIPKFYYKVTPDENGGLDGANIRKCTWEISETPNDGFTLYPAFYDANGNEIDYFLYGAFNGVGQRDSTYGTSYNTSTDKLSSVAGSSYLPTNSLTRAVARTMAANRGTGWYSAGVKQTMAVLMLFAVEYGFNSQIAVGQGVVSASAATYAGQTTGNITSGTQDNKTTPVNWRGIENLWGNIFYWIDGLNVNGRIPYFCNTYTFVDDTSTGYTQISFSLPSSNYITAFGYDSTNDWVLLPSESSSTANPTGPIGDYVYSNSGWRVAQLGGRWGSDSSAGAFYWNCGNTLGAYTDIGARLMYIPW